MDYFDNLEEEIKIDENSRGKKQTISFALIVLVSAIIGGIISSFLIPYLFGLNPIKFYSGEYNRVIYAGGKVSPEYIKKIQESDPVVLISKKVQSSVVNIRTEATMSDFFHQGQNVTGEGSGVIFTTDGYIITNNHVVQNAKNIWVTIASGEDIKGELVGKDNETDIAIIKIPRINLPVAEIGSVKDLQVGELAVAIGSPFGFQHTVTTGVISALHRNVSAETEEGLVKSYTDLIQTDAAINPGNSGGALTNSIGQVIGINTLIYSLSGGSQGIGFAIPIDVAKDVAEQLITEGKASHPYVGISGQTVDRDVAKQYNLPVEEGAMIGQVFEDSPADKAGFKKGDVIISFNNTRIKTMEDLIAEIRKKKVGDKVKLTYKRAGAKREVEIVLEEKPAPITK
ncbi:MAG: trypsin-like peptidase domain-containing protein [Actinobacteria bacterium]|nr:trypsin-like peptidase domain-containing protein [Actinomycetota bacterium]